VSSGMHADQRLHRNTTIRCSAWASGILASLTLLFMNVYCVLCCLVHITAGTSQGLGSTCSTTRSSCLC